MKHKFRKLNKKKKKNENFILFLFAEKERQEDKIENGVKFEKFLYFKKITAVADFQIIRPLSVF